MFRRYCPCFRANTSKKTSAGKTAHGQITKLRNIVRECMGFEEQPQELSLISLVKLLIRDEVHRLHGERGPVVEALVGRTLRLVQSSQSMIRLVGLPATLPNYIDVANFLGVNPTKGTDIYNSKRGVFVDLGILDVLQIFDRSGRPRFDKSGVGTIITTHDKLNHYLSLLTNQFPIESNFIQCLAGNLNADIVLGTITSVEEAIE
uniref:Helicase ATP-binding domain-containing protein n=1 Tax=Glossina pallidipes TaxID=7398 RepID=A0A1A9Z469_GLOPL